MSGVEKTIIPMTKEAAARIQSDAARNHKETGFEARAQAAADKNANEVAKEG
ncbi:hypothetical protein ACKAV7_010538 [Fusarium commune]|uniref:SMP domain-containing protein n=1 Tax=Fusarium oxysporum f. sp. rapae TaxID=485398 RepID=A0A8J5TR69_FUSOX|nr:hypothetical protein Forpe1208_v010449 [Fusarium oxysporum f. sp. rapae]